jgi:hypothetical protein
MLRDDGTLPVTIHGVDFDGTIIEQHTCGLNFSGHVTTRQELIKDMYKNWSGGEHVGICSMCDPNFGTKMIRTINGRQIDQKLPCGKQLIRAVLYYGVLTHLETTGIDNPQAQAQEFINNIFYVIWHPRFLGQHARTPEMQKAFTATQAGQPLDRTKIFHLAQLQRQAAESLPDLGMPLTFHTILHDDDRAIIANAMQAGFSTQLVGNPAPPEFAFSCQDP